MGRLDAGSAAFASKPFMSAANSKPLYSSTTTRNLVNSWLYPAPPAVNPIPIFLHRKLPETML